MVKINSSQTFPYKTGDGSYNRRSGRKTLVLVAVCIILVTILSLGTFFLLLK